jgi:voltage-gated potassium channel
MDSKIQTSRRRVYEYLHSTAVESKTELAIRVFISSLILLSIVAVVLESVKSLESRYNKAFFAFEAFTVIIFSVEYVLRVWSVVENPRFVRPLSGRLRYMCSFLGLVDLVSILPFYLPAFAHIDLRVLRGFRLMRFIRILKVITLSRWRSYQEY